MTTYGKKRNVLLTRRDRLAHTLDMKDVLVLNI
jgi:hypothetical protein